MQNINHNDVHIKSSNSDGDNGAKQSRDNWQWKILAGVMKMAPSGLDWEI